MGSLLGRSRNIFKLNMTKETSVFKWTEAVDTRGPEELSDEEKGLARVVDGKIKAEDLVDPAVFKRAEAAKMVGKLLHKSGVLLTTVNEGSDGTRPHFKELKGELAEVLGRKEIDEGQHDKRISTIIQRLPYEKVLTLRAGSETLLKIQLEGYKWEDEAYRVFSFTDEGTKFLRHDVFGIVSNNCSMSIKKANIAVEVINTHYPEPETLEAMLSISIREPLVIIFDLVTHPNLQRFFFNLSQNRNIKEGVEPTFFIFKGKMYFSEFGIFSPRASETHAACLERRIREFGEKKKKEHDDWLKSQKNK